MGRAPDSLGASSPRPIAHLRQIRKGREDKLLPQRGMNRNRLEFNALFLVLLLVTRASTMAGALP